MKDKIIFWLDAGLFHFGIANSLQKKLDCDLYAIIDIGEKPKKFFKEQKIVDFKKKWFYHDHIKELNKKPDLKYLENFEKKYQINLWQLAYNERLFYRFNEFYKFSTNEVLCILEQECKLFENILEETKPDYFVGYISNYHQDYLFYKICKAKGIKLLLLGLSRFAFRPAIFSSWNEFDMQDSTKLQNNKTIEELQEYLKGHSYLKEYNDYTKQFQNSKKKMFSAVKNLLVSKNENIKSHYSYYGRTKINVIKKSLKYLLKKQYREKWIDNNLVRKINYNQPFLYFPLHMDEEASLLLGAPFCTNQIEIITNIVKSLPIGYKLFVKEHHAQKLRGWRPIEEYKKIMELPNIVLIHPSITSEEILKKCSLVLSITSTTSLESVFHQKPAIIFADAPFSKLESITRVKNMEELPSIIRESLKKEVSIEDLNNYVNMVHENSFEFDLSELELAYQHEFYHDGYSVDVEINPTKMELFLKKYKLQFDKLADEHIKKMECK